MGHALAAIFHWLGALLHLGHPAAGCVPATVPPLPPAALIAHAEQASGGYAVEMITRCRSGERVLEVSSVGRSGLAVVDLRRGDNTLLDLRWDGWWQRLQHHAELRAAAAAERPRLDLVQALQRVDDPLHLRAARLQYIDGRPFWVFEVRAGNNLAHMIVDGNSGRVRKGGA